MSDVERVAAAMREANAELEVEPPDVTGTADHARRSLIRRLLVVGVLSALGATLLIIGGTAPALTHIRATRDANKDQGGGKDGKGGGKEGGGHGGKGGGGQQGGGGGKGGGHKHHEQLVAAVGPGEPIAVELPELIVSRVTKTEVTVENLSPVSAEPFVVSVALEAEGQNTVTVTVPFEEGLEGESFMAEPFELRCESGLITAEVNPADEIEEASDENNESPESPPVKCEPAEDKGETEKEEGGEKAKSKGTTSTGTVGSTTNATGGTDVTSDAAGP